MAGTRRHSAEDGPTCDFGGMMRLIIEVPLPRALSSALIKRLTFQTSICWSASVFGSDLR